MNATELETWFGKANGYLRDHKVAVACSGGRDSMVLLHLCLSARIQPVVLHVNYGLRGQESDDDEKFVRALAHEHNLQIMVKHADPALFNADREHGIQEAARRVRFSWFDSLGFDVVLLAHHANDQAETLLHNAIRGTGLRGLGAMRIDHGLYKRPLIPVIAEVIAQYADIWNIIWREDSSNATTKYTRNKLRHQVMPLLHEVNPKAVEHLTKSALLLQEYQLWFSDQVASANRLGFIDLTGIKDKPYLRVWLFETLRFTGITPEQSEVLLTLIHQTGKRINTSTHVISIVQNGIDITTITKPWEVHIPVRPGFFTFPGGSKIQISRLPEWNPQTHPVNGTTRVVLPMISEERLVVRTWKEGDKMHPFGMHGEKLLSDLFTDEKIPAARRNDYPVMIVANNVLWAMGVRAAEQCRVSQNQKNVLYLHFFIGGHENLL